MKMNFKQPGALLIHSQLAILLFLSCVLASPAATEELAKGPSPDLTNEASEKKVSAEPPARIAVSPSRVMVDLNSDSKVQSIKLVNLDEKPVTVRVSVAHWDLDEKNRVRIIAPTEQSLDQWLIINPLVFTVPGQKAQTVRFSIRPRVRPTPGEHRAMVYFEEVLPETLSEKIRINFKLGVAVYGFASETRQAGILNRVDVAVAAGSLQALFDLSSTGNAHVRMNGNYAVWPAEKWSPTNLEKIKGLDSKREKPPDTLLAGNLPSFPVLGGTRRIVPLNLRHNLRPGEYIIAFSAKLGEGQIEQHLSFTIPSEIPAGIAAR